MRKELKWKITYSNRAIKLLESNGYTYLGWTQDFKNFCILNHSGDKYFFHDLKIACMQLMGIDIDEYFKKK